MQATTKSIVEVTEKDDELDELLSSAVQLGLVTPLGAEKISSTNVDSIRTQSTKPIGIESTHSLGTLDISNHDVLESSTKSILKKSPSYLGDSNNTITSSAKKRLSFAQVNVREYDRTISDNPSCLCGLPVGIDWTYSSESLLELDDYEKMKGMRRSVSVLRMPKRVREDLLRNKLGFSDQELAAVKKEVKKTQRSRSMTDFTSQYWRLEDAGQSIARKMKKTFGGKKTKPQSNHDAAVQIHIMESKRRNMDLERSLGSSVNSNNSDGPLSF